MTNTRSLSGFPALRKHNSVDMRAIIVEDEKHARDNLIKLLQQIDPAIEIQASLDSVHDTVAWLRSNQTDLIFLDIHLADDLSFKIFDQVAVSAPVIFTTAYDQYALRAFKVNSIDYLLKPIDKEELAQSLEKYRQTRRPAQEMNVQQLLQAFQQTGRQNYQQRFLVSRREKIMSVKTEDIAYFEGEDRYVYLVKHDGSRFIVEYKLSDLEDMLDPAVFYRVNRSFIVHFDAIVNIITLSRSRVKVDLKPANPREVIVSAESTRDFKAWLNQ
ncbi:MAG: LytTR family DNA-binding domain-containing protein [Saprospiraceae bacterium]